VEIFNKAAQKILKVTKLTNLKSLDRVHQNFSEILRTIKPSEQKVVKIDLDDEVLQLSLNAVKLKILNDEIKLVSFQNIKHELEEKELDSWQKLISVLTHEIMNSVSPISSTINTITEQLSKNDIDKPKQIYEIKGKTLSKTIRGLNIIEERSRGLLDFVNKFRSITNLPKPDFKIFSINKLFNNIHLLMKENLEKIAFEISVFPLTLNLRADKKMIEQVLINLIMNSIHSVKFDENAEIRIKAFVNENNRKIIQVVDNGQGIPKDQIDEIFIPFFTTKEKGSGIGLSLSRQIIKLHGGTISVQSTPNFETVFSLKF